MPIWKGWPTQIDAHWGGSVCLEYRVSWNSELKNTMKTYENQMEIPQTNICYISQTNRYQLDAAWKWSKFLDLHMAGLSYQPLIRWPLGEAKTAMTQSAQELPWMCIGSTWRACELRVAMQIVTNWQFSICRICHYEIIYVTYIHLCGFPLSTHLKLSASGSRFLWNSVNKEWVLESVTFPIFQLLCWGTIS